MVAVLESERLEASEHPIPKNPRRTCTSRWHGRHKKVKETAEAVKPGIVLLGTVVYLELVREGLGRRKNTARSGDRYLLFSSQLACLNPMKTYQSCHVEG